MRRRQRTTDGRVRGKRPLHHRMQLECLEPRLVLAAFQSDDFNALVLDPIWTFLDPVGDSSVAISGTSVEISVDGGQDHDAWTGGLAAPRLTQAIDDEDLDLEVKFESAPAGANTISGLVVESVVGDFVRFDFTRNSSGLRVFAASSASGAMTIHHNQVITATAPLYLRLSRVGDDWSQTYSVDGSTWLQGADFALPFDVARAGVLVGNSGGSASPSFVAKVDYVFNSASPIEPEDADLSLDQSPPTITGIAAAAPTESLTVTFVTDDPAIGSVRYGTTSAFELGEVTGSGMTQTHSIVIDDLDPFTTYHFRVSAENFNGYSSNSGEYLVRTGRAADHIGPAIDLWDGDNLTFGSPGQPQRWINILGRVAAADGVQSLHYTLNGGAPNALTVGPDGFRLQGTGDFNVEIHRDTLVSGSNALTITAIDTLGRTESRQVNIDYLPDQIWPHDYTVDWSSESSVSDAVDIVDGLWALTDDGIRTVEIGYDRLIGLGNAHQSDYEVVVPVTIHRFGENVNFGPPGVGVIARWSGHFEDPLQPNTQWFPLGGLGWYRSTELQIIGNDTTMIAQGNPRQLSLDATYVFKFRVESNAEGPATYRLKVWEQDVAEPEGWDLVGQGIAGELGAGSALLVAHHADVTFGNVSIVPISDGVAPVAVYDVQPEPVTIGIAASSNAAATWRVDYGLTDQYELGTRHFGPPATSAQLILDGLQPSTAYHVRLTAIDTEGDAASPQMYVVSTLPPDATPPTLIDLQSDVGTYGLVATASTDEISRITVQYGLTSEYELGTAQSNWGLQHLVEVEGLAPSTTYQVRVTAIDASGNASAPDDFSVTTNPLVGVTSDGFGGAALDTSLWTVTDPLGDASVTVQSGRLSISIPGGQSHEIWNGIETAPRVMQAISDVDFQVRVKFDSVPTGQFAMQGVLVETANNERLRFEIFSSATGLHVFGAKVAGATSTALYSAPIATPAGQSLQMRVTRAGASWLQEFSADGLPWTTAASFSDNLVVNSVGLSVGNAGGASAPAVAAQFDLFEASAAPLPDTTPPDLSNLAVDAAPNSIQVTGLTDKAATLIVNYGTTPSFELGSVAGAAGVTGHSVVLAGLSANIDYYLRVVAVDQSGNETTPYDFVIVTPPPDNTPPLVLDLQVVPRAMSIGIFGVTDEPAVFEVGFGLTDSYELGTTSESAVSAEHALQLSGLVPETTYFIRLTAIDASGNVSTATSFTATTTAQVAVTSDGFDAVALDPFLWEIVNPAGDADVSVANQHLHIVVPGGIDHDLWASNQNAPKILQEVSDTDFEVEIKFADQPSGQYAMNGIVVQGNDEWLRFDFFSSTAGINIFAASIVGGTAQSRYNAPINPPQGAPLYMRVNRTGNHWTQSYSFDGETWEFGASFSQALNVAAVGPFAGNAGGASAPGFTSRIDYFENTAAPLPDVTPPELGNVIVTAPTSESIVFGGTTDEPTTVSVLFGLTNEYELGEVHGASGQLDHAVVIAGLSPNTTYYIRAFATDSNGNVSMFVDVASTTPLPDETPPTITNLTAGVSATGVSVTALIDENAVLEIHYGLTLDYELGTVTTGASTSEHQLSIAGLAPQTPYYFRAVARDPSGNDSDPVELVITTDPPYMVETDEFDGAVIDGERWTLVDPIGGSAASLESGHLSLSVPGGTNHDAWKSGIDVPRLMQEISDIDFEIEVKFDSLPATHYTIQGVLVEDAQGNALRFDFFHNGTSVRSFAAGIFDGLATVYGNGPVAVESGQSLYLRVSRTGDVWTQSISVDGASWTAGATFSKEMQVSRVGLFAGNVGANGAPAPAFTMVVDYFESNAFPIPDLTPPQLSNVYTESHSSTSITVTGETDESAQLVVRYGLTEEYELGTVIGEFSAGLQSISLATLEPGATYFVEVVAVDVSGNPSAAVSTVVSTITPGAAVSDEFDGSSVNPSVWTFVDPLGDATAEVEDGVLSLSVPAGTSHDAWSSGLDAPRVMQAVDDDDFDVEVKFDSRPTGRFALNGIIVQSANGEYMRFDFYSSQSGLNLFAASVGVATVVHYNQPLIAPAGPLFMRVSRNGDVWTLRYSLNGHDWIVATQFTRSISVSALGLFTGNAGGASAPAYTSRVDYFRVT